MSECVIAYCVFSLWTELKHTHTLSLTLAGPRSVRGTSPPGAAEKKQIILSGDTAPLDMAAMERALHVSVSVCLPPSVSVSPSFSTPTPSGCY